MEIKPSDISTAPNAISAIGLTLTVHGANSIDTPQGLAAVVVGRTLDLVDGKVARATDHTSEFGAAVDATLDKLGMAAIFHALWLKGLAPKPVIGAMVAQNVANSAASFVSAARHPHESQAPTRDGKYAMALQGLATMFYAASGSMNEKNARTTRHAATVAAIVGTFYFGARATSDYIKRARTSK